MATGCKDKACRLWDTSTGKPLGQATETPCLYSPWLSALKEVCSHAVVLIPSLCRARSACGTSLPPNPLRRRCLMLMESGQSPSDLTALHSRPATASWLSLDRLTGTSPSGNWLHPHLNRVERLRLMIQVQTGWEIGDAEGYRPLTPETWRQRKRKSSQGAPRPAPRTLGAASSRRLERNHSE